MGCTSSVPNTTSTNTIFTEHDSLVSRKIKIIKESVVKVVVGLSHSEQRARDVTKNARIAAKTEKSAVEGFKSRRKGYYMDQVSQINDKCIQYEEEFTEASTSSAIANEANAHESKMLPACDTLVDGLPLDRSHNTLLDLVGAKTEPEDVNSSRDNILGEINKDNDKRILKLEDIVDKVLETKETEKEKVQDDKQSPNEEEETMDQKPQIIEDSVQENKKIDEIEKEDENEKEEAQQQVDPEENFISPSQSESSRATRWEALADIAAELPASLTIDPLTGQIYALSR